MVKLIKKSVERVFYAFKRNVLSLCIGFLFALLCFVALNAAMEPVSTSEYCGTTCHEMDTAYQSWKLSIHGTNEKGLHSECIDCHLPPRENYFSHIIAKAYAGGKDLYKHHFGKEYNVEEIRQKVVDHFTNEVCLRCHVDLLAKPGSEMAKEAHTESLNLSDEPDSKCIECHDDVAHQR